VKNPVGGGYCRLRPPRPNQAAQRVNKEATPNLDVNFWATPNVAVKERPSLIVTDGLL
jgi:hypothetical protein